MKKILIKLLIFIAIYSLIIVAANIFLPDLTSNGRIISGVIAVISLLFAELIMDKIIVKKSEYKSR